MSPLPAARRVSVSRRRLVPSRLGWALLKTPGWPCVLCPSEGSQQHKPQMEFLLCSPGRWVQNSLLEYSNNLEQLRASREKQNSADLRGTKGISCLVSWAVCVSGMCACVTLACV